MIVRALYLIVASAAFWLCTALPARAIWGDLAAVHAGVAVLLCLVPALLTLAWVSWAARNDPRQLPVMALGATGVRMFVVALVALFLYTQVNYFRDQTGFMLWVLVSYLFVLTVEIVLLTRGSAATQPKKQDPEV